MEILVPWAGVLLISEMLIDLLCLIGSVRWFVTNDEHKASFPVRLAVAMIFLHAVRVLVFVLGRVGPWFDFDVRPEYRVLHAERWSWEGVYFSAVMAGLSVIVVITIWVYMRLRLRNKS